MAALAPATGQQSLYGAQGPLVVAVTNTVVEWRALHRTNTDGRVAWGIGAHPGERHSEKDVRDLVAALDEVSVVGEVGLDFRSSVAVSAKDQRRVLDLILDSVEASKKIISLHSVRAGKDVIDMLSGRMVPGAILHWFLGSESLIDRVVDLDLFFSVNPAMLNSTHGRRALEAMPPNRILLETDAPYGLLDERSPAALERALNDLVGSIARAWRLPEEEARARVLANQRAFLERVEVSWSP